MYNPLLNEYIGVHLIDMDYLVKEQVVSNPDGSFSIFINARLSARATNGGLPTCSNTHHKFRL